MDIAGTYALAERMPEVFKQEVWQDERPQYNRPAADAVKVRTLIEALGPVFSCGVIAALPDAIQGAAAPALPLDLLTAAGYDKAGLNYSLDFTAHLPGGRVETTIVTVGEVFNILDGPEGSASERLARFISEVFSSDSRPDQLWLVDPIAQGADTIAFNLLLPFQKKR